MPAFWHKGCQTKSRLALMCQRPRAPTVPLSTESFTGGIEHMDVIQRKRTIGSIIPSGALVAAVGALLVGCGGGQAAAAKSASATVPPVGTPAIPADGCPAA